MNIPNDEVCGRCPFFDTVEERCVPPTSPFKARVMLIGMNPGKTELETQQYFVGPAGRNLDIALAMLGLDRPKDVYITNAVKCYTRAKEESVKATHIRCCRDYLDWEVEQVDPDLIVVAGDIALQAVVGAKGITNKIKQLLWSEHYNKPVIAILHPAAVLHNPRMKRTYLESVAYIGKFLNGELVDEDDIGDYKVLRTANDLDALAKTILNEGRFSFDIENNHRMPWQEDCQLKCWAMSYKPRFARCIPFAEFPTNLQHYAMKMMKVLLTNKNLKVLGHNVWFDLRHFTIPLGIEPAGEIYDTQLEHYLIDENSSHGLKSITWEVSKLGGYERELDALGGPGHVEPGPVLYHYNCIDVDITERAHAIFIPELERQELMSAYRDILMPAAAVLSELESRGVPVDREHASHLRTQAEEMIPELVTKLKCMDAVRRFEATTGSSFNPNSTKQVRTVLFEYERLPIIERTKKTQLPSTKSAVLEKLEEQEESEICKTLLDYRLIKGLHSKYLGKLEDLIAHDDKIHTSYLLHVARSGRTSSANPNLQNIPVRGKDILDVKNIFVPTKGRIFLEADFSQHEYRVVASVAKDPIMLKMFREDDENYHKYLRGELDAKTFYEELAIDLHRKNAAELFGVPYDDVTNAQRKAAKGLSFGVLYGMGPKSLGKLLKCTEEEAIAYLQEYFAKFTGIRDWKSEETHNLYNNKYIITCTGRRRHFAYVDDDAVREGLNTLIQGPASDFMLISLSRISHEFKRIGFKSELILQVHDSILVNVVPEELEDVVSIMRRIMESSAEGYINVPLRADFSIGKSWGSLQDLWKQQ